MGLQLTQKERRLASEYRLMMRRARQRLPHSPLRSTVGPGRSFADIHKAAIAQLFCVATAVRFGFERTGVHVVHIRYSSAVYAKINPGLQRKPHDRWTLPLSAQEHRRQHRGSEQAYWAELSVDPHELAAVLWAASPDVEAMRVALRTVVWAHVDPRQIVEAIFDKPPEDKRKS